MREIFDIPENVPDKVREYFTLHNTVRFDETEEEEQKLCYLDKMWMDFTDEEYDVVVRIIRDNRKSNRV